MDPRWAPVVVIHRPRLQIPAHRGPGLLLKSFSMELQRDSGCKARLALEAVKAMRLPILYRQPFL